MKTQTKIILSLTSIFLVYTILFSGFVYYSISNYSYKDFYKRLEIRAATVATIELEENQDIDLIKEIRKTFLEELPNEKIYLIDLSDYNENKNVQLPNKFIKNVIKNERASYNENNIYYSGIKYTSTSQGNDYVVVASAQNYYNTHHMVYLRNVLIVSLTISLLLILFISYLFSRKVILPIKKMIDNMRIIGSENLNFRLSAPNNNNELKALALSFNDMLNRLETSFETQKNFISNASHELNTPLTSIIGEADVALTKLRTPKEYISSLQVILEEAEKLNKKTKALLYLAQTGYDGKIQEFKPLRIDQLIIDVKNTVEKIYPEAKIRLDFSLLPEIPEKLNLNGNKQLLHMAISNLVMNACKYSNHKLVNIALGVSKTNIIITVKDKGIGIPKNELAYIYDPFFRASNTRTFDGYGIGLPLSRNVIKMHGGELIVNSQQDQGTVVEVKIPPCTK